MKKYINLFIVVIGLSTTGCGSFNTYLLPSYLVLPADTKQVKPEVVTIPVQKETPATDTKPNCPVFQLPVLPKVPELPLKELSRTSPADMEAMDRIQIKHIEELRGYAAKYRQTLNTSYRKYLETCGVHAGAR